MKNFRASDFFWAQDMPFGFGTSKKPKPDPKDGVGECFICRSMNLQKDP